MNGTEIPSLIQGFRGRKVTVVGDAMLDCYLEGHSRRLCREAPVPIVDLADRRDVAGGAANTAVNARALDADVSLVAAVGDDSEGGRLVWVLEEGGVSTRHVVTCPDRRTLTKNRIVSGGQILLRIDQGTTGGVGAEAEDRLLDHLAELYPGSDAVIVSDYGYGVMTRRLIDALAELQAAYPAVLVVDSRHHLPAFRHVGATAVKPNFEETLHLLGAWEQLRGCVSRPERIAACGGQVLEATGARIAAVTLDTDGAMIFEQGSPPHRTYAQPMQSSRAAGAGDTFAVALALALAAGGSAPAAAEIASAAAAVVVGKDGTSTCSWHELAESITACGKFLADRGRLAQRLDELRRQGRRIVFTNGCFDILHRGHVAYLSRAKSLGDVLVVGVNTDEGVARLKGPHRPINCLDDRLQVLAAMSCVDQLVAFDEDTPCELIRVVRPDVFAKGGDYTLDRLPEAQVVEEQGGVVRLLPFLDDRSTSNLIARIQQQQCCPSPATVMSADEPNGYSTGDPVS